MPIRSRFQIEPPTAAAFAIVGIVGGFFAVIGLALRSLVKVPPLVVLDLRMDSLPTALLLPGLFVSFVLLFAWTWLSRREGGKSTGTESAAVVAVYLLFALLGARVVLSSLVSAAGFTFLTGDDFCRMVIASDWTERHFFAPWDHIWLGGHFYLLGSAQHLLSGDPVAAARVVGIFFSLSTLVLLFVLSVGLFDRLSALVALAIAVVFHLMTWLSLSALPTMMSASAVLGWAWFAVRSEERHRFGDQFAASLFLLFGTMFRYEMLALAVVHAVLVIRWDFFGDRSTGAKPGRLRTIGIFALLVGVPWLYHLAWTIDAARILGHPFAHFGRMGPGLSRPGDLWDRLMIYPRAFWQSSRILSLAAPAAVVWVICRARTRARVVIGIAVVGYLALLEIATIRSGATLVCSARVLIPGFLILLPYLGFALANLIRAGGPQAPLSRKATAFAAVILLTTFAGWEIARGFTFPSPQYISPQINRIGRELSDRVVRGKWGPDRIGGVLLEKTPYPSEPWAAATLSRRPDSFAVLDGEGWDKAERLVARGKAMVVIVRFRRLDPPHFELIKETDIYRMYLWHAPNDPVGIDRLREVHEAHNGKPLNSAGRKGRRPKKPAPPQSESQRAH